MFSFRSTKESRQKQTQRRLGLESLERRRLLHASVGWDGPGQGAAELTYYIGNSPDSLSGSETVNAIETALDAWADAVDVSFTRTDTPGLDDSIDITFTNIDGPGSTLARAYFPDDLNRSRLAGDIRFDSSENWEVGNERGREAFDLVWIAAHEIGHSLGIDHIDIAGAILAPSVSSMQSFSGLTDADITAAQRIYADAPKPQANPPAAVSPPLDTDPVSEPSAEDAPPKTETPVASFEPTDVNRDQETSMLDAMLVAAAIRRGSRSASGVYSNLDTNGDGRVSMLDLLQVIRVMREGTTSNATETESVHDDGQDHDHDHVVPQSESDASKNTGQKTDQHSPRHEHEHEHEHRHEHEPVKKHADKDRLFTQIGSGRSTRGGRLIYVG